MQKTVKWKTNLSARRTKFVPKDGEAPTKSEWDSPTSPALDILLTVHILFAISIACFLVLIGAAVAIFRHVRATHPQGQTPAPPQPSFNQHLYAASQYGSVRSPRLVPHQTVQTITAKKSWNTPSQTVEIHPAPEANPTLGARKSPQPAHAVPAGSERVDWAYFNKDFGDLTDPYTSRPRKISGARVAASKRF